MTLVVMNINTVTFVAPNLACGEARGGRIPQKWGCNRRATKPQAKFGATLRTAVLFGAGFVARSLQTAQGYARRSRLACASTSAQDSARLGETRAAVLAVCNGKNFTKL